MQKPHRSADTKLSKREIAAVGALILGSLGIGTQQADASVKFSKPLAHKILVSEAPIIRHNTGLKGRMTISCRHTCLIRAYSKRTGRLKFRLRLVVKRVADHEAIRYEDYSGWFKHDGRTYYLDPPCQPASPCVDG